MLFQPCLHFLLEMITCQKEYIYEKKMKVYPNNHKMWAHFFLLFIKCLSRFFHRVIINFNLYMYIFTKKITEWMQSLCATTGQFKCWNAFWFACIYALKIEILFSVCLPTWNFYYTFTFSSRKLHSHHRWKQTKKDQSSLKCTIHFFCVIHISRR